MRKFISLVEGYSQVGQDGKYYRDYKRGLLLLANFPAVEKWLAGQDAKKGFIASLGQNSPAKLARSRQASFIPSDQALTSALGDPEDYGDWLVWIGDVHGHRFYFVKDHFGSDPEMRVEVPADCDEALPIAQHIFNLFGHGNLREDFDMDDEEETPTEREAYARQRNIEIAVKQFCEKELGWDMDGGYSVIFDADENTLSLSPDEVEATLEQLKKLEVLGEVRISASSREWKISVEIKTPPGFNITPQV